MRPEKYPEGPSIWPIKIGGFKIKQIIIFEYNIIKTELSSIVERLKWYQLLVRFAIVFFYRKMINSWANWDDYIRPSSFAVLVFAVSIIHGPEYRGKPQKNKGKSQF